MATQIYTGGAPAIKQVNTWTFAGTWTNSETNTITIGSTAYTFVTGSSTIATFLATLLASLQAVTDKEFTEITWTGTSTTIVGTGVTAGYPFTATFSTNSSSGTINSGSSSTGTATTACNGPNFFNTAANESTGTIAATGDDQYFQNSGVSVLSGLSNAAVLINNLYVDQSFTGTIGLPVTNSNAYPEYRTQYLAIGQQSPFLSTFGRGNGQGSSRVKINYGSTKFLATVLNSGPPVEQNFPSILLLGTNASNTLNVQRGYVGMALAAGETSTLVALTLGYITSKATDANVRLGVGVTLSGCTAVMLGGNLEINSNISSLTVLGGECIINGTATVGTLIVKDGGIVRYRSSGTITAFTLSNGGLLDFSQSPGCTATNGTIYAGYKYKDPGQKVTWTNPPAWKCRISDGELDLGDTFGLQRS